MTHRAFQARFGTPMQLSWNGEEVMVGSATASPVRAVVDLNIGLYENDRGQGVVARGQLIFSSDVTIAFQDPIWIRGVRWEYERQRLAEDGSQMVFVIRRESDFTTSRVGGYQGRH